VLNKQKKSSRLLHAQLFLRGTNILPGIKNSYLSEPSSTRLRTTGLDGT